MVDGRARLSTPGYWWTSNWALSADMSDCSDPRAVEPIDKGRYVADAAVAEWSSYYGWWSVEENWSSCCNKSDPPTGSDSSGSMRSARESCADSDYVHSRLHDDVRRMPVDP